MNYKNIPTKKLREILNSSHCTGINGKDYEPVKEELQAILWQRESNINYEKLINERFQEE